MIVLHYTAMKSCEAALERLCSPDYEVSAHYLISRDGTVFQLVDEEMRAWHAGQGVWGSCTDINSHSIGIELDNAGDAPYSAPLMDALESLLPEIMARHQIAQERVIGHSDMAPLRKADPGRRFDWNRLAKQGLAVWPETAAIDAHDDTERWHEYARQFGYCSQSDQAAILAAFRDRFRHGHLGPLDGEDMRIIQNLAARFPVDGGATNT
ncbi:N-acetylmuramoyl-L-alanine amidase [Falsihalocynthiibacter sp. SS001]|uniref:N-acetylmuramoyl-L-alanine amidase n=1 Tax=Falsihalocynthiibacter sp. SS001 TaxID=3349698 RepID=UPI0036D34F2A